MASDLERTEQINILFISPTFPYPATDGGRIRVLNLVRCLCRIHKITLLTFIASEADEQGAGYLREMGMEVVGVRRENQRPGALHALLQSFVRGKPLTVAKHYSAEMVEALRDLLRTRTFDIVHFEMLHTGQFLLHLKGNGGNSMPYATVLGEQNIDSHIWRRLAREETSLLKKLIFYWQYRKFMRYESRLCCRFDMCVCVSAEDKENLASLCPDATINVVPNGVDPDYFRPEEAVEDTLRLVFTGSMDWHPNDDAVLYFCEHIFPLIRAKLPDIEFYIVGSNPTDRVTELRRIQGVTVTGSVEDVRPYIANAAVFVVPLRIGGGTRLKILQALAMKKAVISTTIGCEGLELQQDKHLLVADEPEAFAAGVVRLIGDKQLRRELGENGRNFVQERYDWEVITSKLSLIYRRLVS